MKILFINKSTYHHSNWRFFFSFLSNCKIRHNVNFHKIIIRDSNKFMIINHQRFSFCIISEKVLAASGEFDKLISKILRNFYSLKCMGCIDSPFKHVLFRMKLASENWIITSFNCSNISGINSSCIRSSHEETIQIRIFSVSTIINCLMMLIIYWTLSLNILK